MENLPESVSLYCVYLVGQDEAVVLSVNRAVPR